MHAFHVAVSAPIPVGGGEVQVLPQVADPSVKRRRISVKGADPSCRVKRRRLSVKAPHPSLYPLLPRPQVAAQPLNDSLWNDCDEASFDVLMQRRSYRYVYNKLAHWFSGTQPDWKACQDSFCMEELWSLGRKDYQCLSKQQRNRILQNFLHVSSAPSFVCSLRFGSGLLL